MANQSPRLQLRFDSVGALWDVYLRAVTEGRLFVPSRAPYANGAEVDCSFLLPDRERGVCPAVVVEPVDARRPGGLWLRLQPDAAFIAFVDRARSEGKAGRIESGGGGHRTAPRYATCLDVEFRNYPRLSVEYASNISRGGLFVRTMEPPPLRTALLLSMKLPSGEKVETEAEVVHRVTPEEAQARGGVPGVGLAFTARSPAFFEPFCRLMAEYQSRPPRLLALLGGPEPWRKRLERALAQAGLALSVTQDPAQTLQQMPEQVFVLDMLIVDGAVAGATEVIERTRLLSGAADLRIVLLTPEPTPAAGATSGALVDAALHRALPPDGLAEQLLALLGRAAPELPASPPTPPPLTPPAAPAEPKAAHPRFGNFELLHPLGRGGMASVYQARVLGGSRAGQLVALKRLHEDAATNPEIRALFEREAAVGQLLSHPNIVRVHEAGQLAGVTYLSMEWVDGIDLGYLVGVARKRRVSLPVEIGLYTVSVLLRALDHVHTALSPLKRPLEIVHRDVSSSNVFVSTQGELKLGDFGLAQWRMSGFGGQAAGKPSFVSPEVLAGKVDRGADLWASAVVLYHLLTLELPFGGKTHDDVLSAVRKRKWRSPRKPRPELPKAFDELFERCFAKAPEDRFPTGAAFAEALERLFDPAVGSQVALASVVQRLSGSQRRLPSR